MMQLLKQTYTLLQWHALDRSEQAKYYEMARKEKELHLQLYPGWSARDNYAAHQKKKKRKKDGSGGGGGSSMSGAGVVGHGGLSPMGGVSGMSGGGSLGCLSLDLENKSGWLLYLLFSVSMSLSLVNDLMN